MGRKRRHQDRNSKSERLLKKLRRELRKRRRRSHSSSSSRSSEMNYESEMDDCMKSYQGSDIEENSLNEILASSTNAAASSSSEVVFDGHINDPTASEHLDDEILMLLGDAPNEESVIGKDVHIDIVARLKHVLQNGLKKDQKDKIKEDYPIPGNCQLFKAPILNPEVKAAVSEVLQKKDASLGARQGQLGVVLSALTSVMDILITNKSDTNQILLKHVSNACRLLCDSHHIDTKLRRNFLISTLNNKLKDTLKESKRDKYLFGEFLAENLKANQAITKSSLDLKPHAVKPKPSVKINQSNNSSNHLNWKHPQFNPQNRRVMSTVSRTAGFSSTAHRNRTTRKPSARAHLNSTHNKMSRKH